MIRSGTVVKEEPQGVLVRFGRLAACAGCAACGRDKKETTIFVYGEAKVGDVVSVQMPEAQVLRASLITYLTPLAGLLVGLGIGGWAGAWRDGPMLLAGFLGLALGAGLIMMVDKRLGTQKKWQAHIVAVNDPALMEEELKPAAR